MNTNDTIQIIQQASNVMGEAFIGKYGWIFIVGVIALMFKSSIEKFAAALFVFLGSNYDEDDVVYLNGKPARIIRVGFTKTVFFIYQIEDGKIVGGNKLVVQNEQLASFNIEKPLPLLDLKHKPTDEHK